MLIGADDTELDAVLRRALNVGRRADLYVKNDKFAAVADEIDRGLQQKPPKVMTPEDLRAKLLAIPGNEKSVYLNTASRMENK